MKEVRRSSDATRQARGTRENLSELTRASVNLARGGLSAFTGSPVPSGVFEPRRVSSERSPSETPTRSGDCRPERP